MNLSLITEQSFLNRYETAPDEIRDALDSEEARNSLVQLSQSHYLTPEKAEMLERLTGFVLLGYVSPRDLTREIAEHLFLNHEHARVLANEVHNRVLEPIAGEIEEFYHPLEETEEDGEIKIEAREEGGESPVTISMKEGAPLVLHEEPSFFAERSEKPKKPFLPFFATSPESEMKPQVRAKIETPLASFFAGKPKEDEKKVVHYSELRSSIAPAAPLSESFINLEALEKARAAENVPQPSVTEEKPSVLPVEPVPEKQGTGNGEMLSIDIGAALDPQRKDPEIDGNTIRLK